MLTCKATKSIEKLLFSNLPVAFINVELGDPRSHDDIQGVRAILINNREHIAQQCQSLQQKRNQSIHSDNNNNNLI